MKKTYFLLFLITFILLPLSVLARSPNQITDWYIKSFNTEIQVYEDSHLLVTEMILADCGNLPNKHGIFRVLPTQIKTDMGTFETPIELVSITNFEDNPREFEKIIDNSKHTITWKIGNKDKTVSGVRDYKIVYKVKNAIRFQDEDFDELYWNLLGNFWQLEIDLFHAKIIFPDKVNILNTTIDYYTGHLGSKSKDLADYRWIDNSALVFASNKRIDSGEGITMSAIFPKGIFTPYKITLQDKWNYYSEYAFYLMPIIVFIICFLIWRKHGKDPKVRRPISPEFGIPDKITPIQMGMIISSGRWNNKLITATIIDLAVRKLIIIKEIKVQKLFIKIKSYKLIKTDKFNLSELTKPEKIIVNKMFLGNDSVILASLKNTFYKGLGIIKKAATDEAVDNKWVTEKGSMVGATFIIIAALVCSLFFRISQVNPSPLMVSVVLSGIILTVFGVLMPKRTPAGAELYSRIMGFKLYMRKAEKYRQQFYEEENIFDKLLPYAVLFGMTRRWAKTMEKIYGKEYFATYRPVWFVGGSFQGFNANAFISTLNGITSNIASSTGTGSGAGGAGGSGGGGGGGGGGGW
jgi:uncharacterized membrane protein